MKTYIIEDYIRFTTDVENEIMIVTHTDELSNNRGYGKVATYIYIGESNFTIKEEGKVFTLETDEDYTYICKPIFEKANEKV